MRRQLKTAAALMLLVASAPTVFADSPARILKSKTISIESGNAVPSPAVLRPSSTAIELPIRTDTRGRVEIGRKTTPVGAKPIAVRHFVEPETAFPIEPQEKSVSKSNRSTRPLGKSATTTNLQANDSSVKQAYAELPFGESKMIRQVVELQPIQVHDIQTATTSALQPIRRSPVLRRHRIQPAGAVPNIPNVPQPAIEKRQPKRLIQQVDNEQPFLKAREIVRTPVAAPAPAEDRMVVPMQTAPVVPNASLNLENDLVTLMATGASLPDVLRMIAEHHGLNLVVGPKVTGPVTVSIRGARLDEVLDAILGVAGFGWHQVDNILYVTGGSTDGMDPRVQGRVLRVYPLDYVSATEVETVATSLLTRVGSVHIAQAQADDQLRTRELLVVEDTEAGHARVAQYLAQVDTPPRQVLIEAHVLQIALDDNDRHGINLRALARVEGAAVELAGTGFADDADKPSVALRINGRDLESLVESIRSNTNSRTLASPKVSVVNHQEAKIQIGQKLPYSVATTTQTSTIQNINFLEVGIVLTVKPVITDDGNVLMNVFPKVSGGRITDNGFPEEDTTEVSTTVLMPDGGGLVIGGLIREEDSHTRSMLPGLGKVPVVGRLFRRRADTARRNELVVALVTHVLPDLYSQRSKEMCDLNMAVPSYSRPELRHPVPNGQEYRLPVQAYQQ